MKCVKSAAWFVIGRRGRREELTELRAHPQGAWAVPLLRVVAQAAGVAVAAAAAATCMLTPAALRVFSSQTGAPAGPGARWGVCLASVPGVPPPAAAPEPSRPCRLSA